MPLAELTGPLSSEAAAKWAASEGVELRTMWNGRTAIAADDARAIYDRASAAAETVRQRNAVKTAEIVAAIPPVFPGKPGPPGLTGVSALEWMKAGERDERLEKLDELYQEYAGGGATFHPIKRD